MNRRILVVEDYLETRDALRFWLEGQGFEVSVASNGREGIEKARTEKPDLIITDINMPDLNGIDMIRHLRSMPECHNVQILVLTAYHMDYEGEATKAGANRALAKPVDPQLLSTFIRDLLELNRQSPGPPLAP
jgi:CheY-like chemotaxis protein